MTMIVRTATESDLRALVAMAKELSAENPEHRDLGHAFDEARVHGKFTDLLRVAEVGRARVLIAVDEHKPLGMIAGILADYAHSFRAFAAVLVSYARPGEQRGVVLKALVDHVSEWAADAGAREVEFEVAPSMAAEYAAALPGAKTTPLLEKHLG